MCVDWNDVFDATPFDIDVIYQRFFSLFVSTVESFIPHKNVTIRPRDKPWMTGQIRRSIRKRDRLLKTYSKRKLLVSWDRYRVQRNLVVCLVRKAKINYNIKINQTLSDPAISSKKWWGIVKSLYGNKCHSAIPAICEGNVLISDPKREVHVFNEYFVSQATLSNNDSAEIPFLLRWSPDSISVITTDEQMVHHLLSTVNTPKACGCDGISNKIIRFCCEGLYKPFTSLINTSFRHPSAWKLANVLPLFKKDDRQLKTNYRPVSLLSSLSKICEKVALFHLFNFLSKIGFFYRFQSGFRPGDSTVMQLVYIVHKIYEALEEGSEMRAVFLDISKAFDRVWHRGLIARLRSIGIEGSLLNWFVSYLSCRKQRVIIEGVHSDWCNIETGVPQGSVLGPLLFLININDLPTTITSNCFLFADDCFLLEKVQSPGDCAAKLNHDLRSIPDMWLVSL